MAAIRMLSDLETYRLNGDEKAVDRQAVEDARLELGRLLEELRASGQVEMAGDSCASSR